MRDLYALALFTQLYYKFEVGEKEQKTGTSSFFGLVNHTLDFHSAFLTIAYKQIYEIYDVSMPWK